MGWGGRTGDRNEEFSSGPTQVEMPSRQVNIGINRLAQGVTGLAPLTDALLLGHPKPWILDWAFIWRNACGTN